MKTTRFLPALLLTGTLWAGYQYSYSDNLTAIDSSKWSQIGSLSASANGITGNGALISTVAVPTGNDYDERMTIQTAKPGPCAGSYTLYARSAPDNSTAYALTASAGQIALYRVVANSWTELSWLPYSCGSGTAMRLVVRGNSLTFWSGTNSATYQDASPIAVGQPGVGISSSEGDAVGSVQIGPIGYLPPAAVKASTIETSSTPNRVDLRWPAAVADASSVGLQGYVIYRDGVYLGSSQTPKWLDQTVTGGENTTYSIYTADQHGNLSTPATVAVKVPEGPPTTATPVLGADAHLKRLTAKIVPAGPSVDQREVGVRPTGTYWGAAGENIDLLSGNLNFSVPLIKAMGRTNWSVTFALSYNSQMWRQDLPSNNVWLLGEDVGLGLGWTLQAGSILPQWYNGTTQYYLYTDSSGAQYVLDQNNGSNVWSSEWGVYVWYDANADVLHFRDGSFWNMSAVSAWPEQDAGTIYPTQMEDTNGNYISIEYGPALGCYGCYNNSSRIIYITDPRGTPGSVATYSLVWSGTGIPHLAWITNAVGTPENYNFATASQTLLDPFASSNFGTATTLQTLLTAGVGLEYKFQYNSAAEMTQMTTPLGGVLGWTYLSNAYGTRSYREVSTRSMQPNPSATAFTWTLTHEIPSNSTWHSSATMTDNGVHTSKVYSFIPNLTYWVTPGLISQYQEVDASSNVLLQKNYRWGTTGGGNPWASDLTTTLNPGMTYAATAETTQGGDGYGNVTWQNMIDYSGSPTGNRSYNSTYLYQSYGGTYTPAYIFNRLLSATVSPWGGSPITLSSSIYDASCGGSGLIPTSATNNHDSAYNTYYPASGGKARGNPTSVSGLNGSDTVCTAVDSAGVTYYSGNAAGQSVSITTDATTNYSLPTTISPNGTSAMNTTATYATSWSPTSLLGPNGGQATTTYDSYGRPSQSTTPDGAVTTYTYTYFNPSTNTGANTQTATLDGRWQTTTLDGFGRTIQVQKGNGSTTVSTVQTLYAACACSPLGKMSAVSQPYAPGVTPVWTTYTHDGSGRTLTVTAPDGVSTTTYLYQGNSTTVTDPAGKWKKTTVDAYGNVTQVTEPNPAGGTFATNYTYTPVNQLTTVSMTRGSVTETRTYLYTGSDLVSATNPENGTITYTYDNAHHVLTRTDAMANQTQYTYDSYGRLSETQYFPAAYYGTEDTSQRVNYYYDNNVPQYSQAPTPLNGTGLLTGVGFGGGTAGYGYAYVYSYNSAGRITTQTSAAMVTVSNPYPGYPAELPMGVFTNTYQWDDEGRMTSMAPSVSFPPWPYPTTLPTMGYQFDANGQLNTVTSNGGTFATATYTATGQLNTLSYGGLTETRQYNTLGQLTSQSVPGYLNMTYNYSATQNNGRITSSVDGITGENTSYTYDALNRLTGASNSQWSETYGYDGFGNLTSKVGSGGSPNAAPTMSASYNAKNQQAGASYDANGNILSNYNWNYSVENKLTTQFQGYSGPESNYSYDPWGKRVMKLTNPDPYDYYGQWNPQYEFYFYTITGQRLVTMDCNNPSNNQVPSCWVAGENEYFGSKLIVSNGVYVVTDRLGSVRANTQGESFAYYPYGEERTSRVDDRDKFATYFRDAPGQDYADQRYYNSGTGRFWTVDPGGINTASPSRPSSWNRYSYTEGDPVNYMDPGGLFRCKNCSAPDEVPPPPSQYNGNNGSAGPTFNSGIIDDPADLPPSAFPKCNPSNDANREAGLDFVANNYSSAMTAANTIQADLQGINPGLSIDVSSLAVTLLQWSASETGTANGWGTGYVLTTQSNYFGAQVGAAGSIACTGTQFVPGSANACFAPSTSLSTELFSVLSGVPHTASNPNPGNLSYLNDLLAILVSNPNAGTATLIQGIANAGWNAHSTYGSTVAKANVQGAVDCMKRNNYIQ